MRPKKKRFSMPLFLFGALLVMVAAYYCSAGMRQGETIFQWYDRMNVIMQEPFYNYWNNDYIWKTMALFLLAYAFAVMMYITGKRNYLPGKEMGSSDFANVKEVNAKLADLSNDVDDPQNIVIIKRRRWF
ncbi:MAG: hypothetical protein ACI4AD_05680 [Roseburia sp.]